ncbi:TniQ protein [Kutzneria buriramensis]|uniref:TniQ protein n=1 Tax=Kutzneria buriramensis TaxID=1045776 RepID=A0A3E0GXR3_9PSEU|nr:TniQ protein [Kutzneria buriramensis]
MSPEVRPALPRWPVHPLPQPLESLDSWVQRLARAYSMPVRDLMEHNLGGRDAPVYRSLYWDPPAELLAALADRTGVSVARLRIMTLAGWVPWLFDNLGALPPGRHAEAFENYVRANSVLLAPGEAGSPDLEYPRGWTGPWYGGAHAHRACPVCALDPDRGTALVWQLPLVMGCGEHGCRLVDKKEIAVALSRGRSISPTAIGEPLATLDRYTYTALATGRVELPGRSVHAGVWFRLLRSLVDEVSLSTRAMSASSRHTLGQVWATAGLPARAGIYRWAPYESLNWETQQAMLLAAATALRLAEQGKIVPRGRLGSAVAPGPRRHVFDGHHIDVAPVWQQALSVLVEQVLARACADRETAEGLLTLVTRHLETRDEFEEARACLFGAGVPAAFLPTAGDLGRIDLA